MNNHFNCYFTKENFAHFCDVEGKKKKKQVKILFVQRENGRKMLMHDMFSTLLPQNLPETIPRIVSPFLYIHLKLCICDAVFFN